MIEFAKVWPLKAGMKGFGIGGTPSLIMQPGTPAWLPIGEAREAEKRGDLQLMAGIRPQDLKDPFATPAIAETQPVTEKVLRPTLGVEGAYHTKVMTTGLEVLPTEKEEEEVQPEPKPEPKPAPKKVPVMRRRRKQYNKPTPTAGK